MRIMKNLFLTLSICFSLTLLQAQIGVDLVKYDFKSIPMLTPEEDSLYAKDKILGLGSHIIWDYRVNTGGQIEVWYCLHSITKVYDAAMMKDRNRMTFSADIAENIINCKGRLISADGQITILTKADLKELLANTNEDEDEESEAVEDKKVHGLIFEEAKAGDIIEFFYILKLGSIPEAKRFILQDQYTNKNVEFTLILPQYLKADVRSYNGFPEVKDTVVEKTKLRYAHAFAPEVPGYRDDLNSFFRSSLQTVEFMIAYNYTSNKGRFNSFSSYGTTLQSVLSNVPKADMKALKKIIAKMNITKEMSEREKIREIELYVKKNYMYASTSHPSLQSIEGVHKTGFGNMIGLTKLFFQLFQHYDIPFELVLTSNKMNIKFDKDFDSNINMNELLFYFPSINEYVSPDWMNFRLGLPPYVITGQDAIAYEIVTVGKMTTYLPQPHAIPLLPMEKSGDSLKVHITMQPSQETVNGHVRRAISGYSGIGLQANFSHYEAEDKEYLISHFLGFGSENNVVANESFANYEAEDVAVKPFVMEADFSSSILAKFRENEITLSVGQLIGKQDELKQEGERSMPAESAYRRFYFRDITIDIPEGYTCEKLDSLISKVYDTENEKEAQVGFEVTAKQVNNQIIITCYEFYNSTYYPATEFEKYQNVVNAAFQFNKATLVFKKK